jgi:hypothetical protein
MSSPFTEPATGSWQLIGNPFTSDASLSSTSEIPLLLYWDNNPGKWVKLEKGILKPGLGYLVNCSTSHDVDLSGSVMSSPFTEPATGSWQLIGNPFSSNASLSLEDTTINLINYWNGTQWAEGDVNNILPGTAYLILTKSIGTLKFTPKWAPTNTFTLHLSKDWNGVSVPFYVNPSVLDCNKVQFWNGSDWEDPTASSQFINALKPGTGYLILTTSQGTLTFTKMN